MKTKVVSVLGFPYANKFEVRVSRSLDYATQISKVNIYSAPYSDLARVNRLAKLAGTLVGLSLQDMVKNNIRVTNPFR